MSLDNENQTSQSYQPYSGPTYNVQPEQPQFTVVQVKAPFNHTPHIILSFLTCGAWLVVWLICWCLH